MKNLRNQIVKVSAFLSAVVLCACAVTFSQVAYAQKISDDEYVTIVNDLRRSFGYMYSFDDLDSQIRQVTKETGRPKLSVAQEALTLSRKYETGNVGSDTDREQNSSKHNDLDIAHNPGDVFVSEGNNTFGWNHGHAGIFVRRETIIEAVDRDHNAHEVSRKKSVACGRAHLQSVRTSQANRDKAVRRARSYIGRGYNTDVIHTNRNDWGELNCSQLVWAAYMYGAAIDLAPKDNFVFPYSIRDSYLTTTYRTINV
ncbi:hypothetical protein EJ419_01325 [Alloscardovia theropitheci]|uniref:Hydrolase n=1 Tax=Alloscardovia theropitheci TaxID=2496842 RepID=A0A4V2MU29_9BIFI|nr:hypothetical protein [Alloscardovia theropitheci]TCD54769.1 hypothetical protein EJ419_01325 [Alloscardovia theropitheci]